MRVNVLVERTHQYKVEELTVWGCVLAAVDVDHHTAAAPACREIAEDHFVVRSINGCG